MPLLRDTLQNDLCQALITRITTGSIIAAPLLRVYDGDTMIAECAIGTFSSPVNGISSATVADDTGVSGTPGTYEIIGRANTVIMSGDITELPCSLVNGTFSVLGGLRVSSPAFQVQGDEMAFITEGASFSPIIEVSGAPAILWTFADGSTSNMASPTVNYGSDGTRVSKLKVTPWSAVNTINLGYNHEDNGDNYTPISYDHNDQRVSEIINLHLVRESLYRFLSSGNMYSRSLIKSINFGGFSNLHVIEFYYGSLEAINLYGCSSLVRICLEECNLTYLDISDLVNIEDVRAASNLFPDSNSLVFASSYPALWHLCIRSNENLTTLPAFNTTFPNIREPWVWDCNLSGSLGIGANNTEINNFGAANNNFTETEVDEILLSFINLNIVGNTIDVSGNTPPSPTGIGYAQTLIARGWVFVLYDDPVTPTVETPTFNPATGTYTSASVSINCATSGAVIHYTTDGSTPTESSPVYTSPISLSTNGTTTQIRAIGILYGYNNSAIGSASYTISNTVATPTINPAGGTFNSAQSVSISCTTPDAAIYYRINSGSYSLYTTPISVSESQSIESYATHSNMTDSNHTTASFTIEAASPYIEVTTDSDFINMNFTLSSGTVSWTLDVNGTPINGTGNIAQTWGTSAVRVHRITFSNPAALTDITNFGYCTINMFRFVNGSAFTSNIRLQNYPSRVLDWDVTGVNIRFVECGSYDNFYPYTEGLNSLIDACVRSGVTGGTMFYSLPPIGYDYANYNTLFTTRGWTFNGVGGRCIPRP